MAEEPALLECEKITKSFGDNHVLKDIALSINAGEVVALIGGNGAGKSTLVKIFMGIYRADSGSICFKGDRARFINPSVALSNGVYLVPQEPLLFMNMTVAENVLLGLKGNKRENRDKLLAILEQMNWKVDIERRADTLTIAEQQLVEIVKGIIRESDILILDEPTSSLTFNEVQSLFDLIRSLRQKNVGIIYITHRLNEVFDIATRVVVLRDGRVSLQGATDEFAVAQLVQALLPEDASVETAPNDGTAQSGRAASAGEEVFRVESLSGNGFKDVTLSLHAGEILGLAGVVGAGRTEFAETLFGKDQILGGTVHLDGKPVGGRSTGDLISLGLNYVPEDRFKNGIFLTSDIGMNVSASLLSALGRVFVDRKKERRLYEYYKQAFSIRSTGITEEIGQLSGGNQQKVVIAKTLASDPKVLILDEPTRGIDAGARGDVYRIIRDLKGRGMAILLITSDMEEIVLLADRALTMYRGRINGEYVGDQITQENLMSASFGVSKGEVSK